MRNSEQLRSDQVEILYQSERLKESDEEPVVVSQSAVEAVREVMGEALREQGLRDPSTLSLESLARQFQDDEGEVDANLLALDQTPETGGTDGEALAAEQGVADADDDEPDVAALVEDNRDRVEELVDLCDRHSNRLPHHVSEWEQEALSLTEAEDRVIALRNAENTTVTNNEVAYGEVVLMNSNDNTLSHNVARDLLGIYIYSDYNTVVRNDVRDSHDGIVDEGENNRIHANITD